MDTLSPHLLQELVATPHSIILYHRLDGIVCYVSSASQAMLGRPASDFVGHPLINSVHPEDRKKLENSYEQAQQGIPPAEQLLVRVADSTGRWVWLELSTTLVKEISQAEDGIPVLQSIGRNVTTWVERENRLSQAHNQLVYQNESSKGELRQLVLFERLLRFITDKILASFDEGQLCQSVVKQLTQEMGLLRCIIGLLNTEEDAYHIHSEWGVDLPFRLERLSDSDFDLLLHSKQQEIRTYTTQHPVHDWCSVLVAPIFTDEIYLGFIKLVRQGQQNFVDTELNFAQQVAGQCAIGILQARLFRQTQDQVIKLQEMSQIKDDFIHMVSHELRTPLSNMKMALTLLEVHKNNPDKQIVYMDSLKNSWQQEVNLVNELLELQALDTGNRTLNLVEIDLPETLPALIEPIYLRCAEREQFLSHQWDPSVGTITTDRALLERILLELLNNACKYTPPQGSITLLITTEADHIHFQITNTGVTIPPDEIPKLFDKFHRIARLDTHQQGGTGLGLALAKKACELLQGEIEVTSQDKITCFAVRLPVLIDIPTAPDHTSGGGLEDIYTRNQKRQDRMAE